VVSETDEQADKEADKQTYKHTDKLIAILHKTNGGDVNTAN